MIQKTYFTKLFLGGLIMERKKITISTLREKMESGEQITMITGYDYPTALLEERAGIDIILMGDSIGMTVLGYDSTLPVKMDIMIEHAKAVRKGAPSAYLVGDMPYMTYQINKDEAIRNAGRFMSEAGTDCIKLEGGRNMAETIRAIVNATIPVMGHIGLTPQSIAQLGGFKAQGRDIEAAKVLIEDAKILEEAGVSTLLVEAVPPEVMEIIVSRAKIPVISLGSGKFGHGQLLIFHDMVGFFDAFTPKFVKKYANINDVLFKALSEYVSDIKTGAFPEEKHTYRMKENEAARFRESIGL